MATALDRAGSEGGRRRRKRARRRAEAVAEAAVSIPIVPPVETVTPEVAESETTAPKAAVAAVEQDAAGALPAARARLHRTPRRRVEHAPPAPAPEPEAQPPEPAAAPEPEKAPVPDGFRDLLGQASGIRLDSVTREFHTGDMKVVALGDVSLEIAPGEFVAVIGPSGCGKTTLLSLMGGLDKPTSGQVYASGMALDQLSEKALADYRLQRVSTIFQTFNLVPAMSALENVVLPLTLAGASREERRNRAHRLLDMVGLKGRAGVRASRLSGGEQQKVAVARAIANRPGLILADEPTGSLDSAAGERVLELLQDLNRRGATIVLVTHDPEVARRANRAVRMMDGRAFELDSGARNVRNQDPMLPPARMHWRDTLRLGFLSAGRRPLRTFLTTTGVAIGIAAMSLIVALSGGLDHALSAPALGPLKTSEISVRPAPSAGAFDAASLATLAAIDHVQAAWGDVSLAGAFAFGASPSLLPEGQLMSLAPRARWDGSITLIAGTMPASDSAAEIVLGAREATALGFVKPQDAIGKTVTFTAAGRNPVPLYLTVVGVASDSSLPAGTSGGLAPYALMTTQWASLARANGSSGAEFKSITLLIDSSTNVESVRSRLEQLGFQAQPTGDQQRAFVELLGRLRVALLGLSVVALFLACLGIANTMYTAVLERTKEIGILKAVGARSRDILLLFVAEAAIIGLAGGVLGGGVAAVLARAGNAGVDALVPTLGGGAVDVFRPDLAVALLALALAVLLSMGSGLLPAMRAAAQQPMKALHYE